VVVERVKAKRTFWALLFVITAIVGAIEWRVVAVVAGGFAIVAACGLLVWLFGEAYDGPKGR
jgi:hypothetical protein